MTVDEELSKRFRKALGKKAGVSEKKMMGGLCFMLNGNMVGGVDRTKDGVGRFMFRVGSENYEAAVELPGAEPMVQGGRRMKGFFFVNADDNDDDV